MEQANQTVEGQAKSSDKRQRSVGLIILGVVLILLALVWAAPIAAYYLLGDKIMYQDLSLKENLRSLSQIPHSPVNMIVWTIMGSPLPLFLFGLGLLWSARWAKYGAMVTLLAQLAAILATLHVMVRPFLLDDMSVQLMDRPTGYLCAGGAIVLNGLLILFLALAGRRKRT